MQILDWKPEIGERAVVPGGPACAQYVTRLEDTDVQAIERGHKGYYPLHLVVINAETGESLDCIQFSERFGKWCCDGGTSRTLDNVRRRARRHFNCRIAFRARNLTKGRLNAALEQIHEMAAEDLRVGRVFVCHSFLSQIEATSRAALNPTSDES